MNRKERLELAHWVAAQAKKSGANEARVNLSNSRDIEILHHDDKLENLKESTQNSLNLYIYANNRYSGHTTNDIRKESLGKFIRDAVDMTKYLSEDPYRTLPDPKYYEGRKDIDLKLLDSSYESVNSEQRVRMARELEEALKSKADNIVSCSGEYSDTISESVKVNSNGFEGEEASTFFYIGADVYLDDGSGGRISDYAYGFTRFLKDLPPIEEIAEETIMRANRKIGQEKIDTGVYNMLVESRTARSLIGRLSGFMSGRSLQQKNTCLADKLYKQIASDKLTLIDDPFLVTGLGSRLYDDEGMSTKKRIIIDKGVFKSFFIGYYYAKKLETEPTCSSYSNFVVTPGKRSSEEIVKSMDHGIYITSFIGGNTNPATGDYSFGIVGLLVENGKFVKPVNEMNISGNLLDLFMNLEEVGNDPFQYSSRLVPSLLFKNVQFSGA